MLYAVGADEKTPYVKLTNKGGKTTLAQDPSSYYINTKGLDNLQTKNANASYLSSGMKSGGAGSTKAATGAGTSTGYEGYSGGGGGGFDLAAYLAALAAQKQAAAQAAYERSMNRIKSGYESAYGSLRDNYGSTVDRLNAARDKSMGDVNADAEDSLRQAYINNMLTRKNLNQRLSAMGYNGGATESTMAQLENQYGNSRTGINETLNKNLANLDMTYGDNLAQALQSFNSAKANLDLQRMQMELSAEQALANAQASSANGIYGMDSSYLSALQNAVNSQGAYSYDPTQATNNYIAGNVQQAQSANNDANYAKYLAQAQLEASNGASANAIKNNLFAAKQSGKLNDDTLYSILHQLGLI